MVVCKAEKSPYLSMYGYVSLVFDLFLYLEKAKK